MNGTRAVTALIVDDEPPARRRLRKLLEPIIENDRLEIVGEAADGVEALEFLENEDVDLAFLDIQMPEMNGFELLERLDPKNRPVIIFTTAYDTYALRAFEENAVDYLLKPISKDRLAESVERARKVLLTSDKRSTRSRNLEKLLDWLESQEGTPGGRAEHHEHVRQLSVPFRDRILLIPVEDVVSAEINEGITRIFALEHEEKGPKPRLRQHVVNYTLDQLETMLPFDRFMRIHRSAIVQLDAIQELIPWFSGRYKLVLTGDHEVIASRERSKQLKDTLMI